MISDEAYEWLLDTALRDQADAHRWWWITTFSTPRELQHMFALDKSEWNAYVDAKIAEYDD